jgi:cellulose synthase/poly-beta-1,6-N-acetylglucosamine synthase-like glycosyltransferase
MTVLFWIGMVWVLYVYLGYPLILAVLARVGRRIHPVIKDDFLPGVSVLISARNEEKDIGWKMDETLGCDYPRDRLELLVASDASEDRTDEIVRGITDPRLKLVRMEQRSGKGVALNRLAQLAQGELLFFTDANAHIPAHCLRRMARYFADARVGCVTGMTSAQPDADLAIGSGDRLYLGYETTISHLESQLGSVLVCDGAIFCIRRSLFQPLSPELANDLELPVRIGHAGYWVLHEPTAQVFEKETSSPRE